MRRKLREMPVKQGSGKGKPGSVFGQGQKPANTVRAGLHARVSTHDHQTLPMQNPGPPTTGLRRWGGRTVPCLIGEKLFAFLMAAERDTLFAAEVPAFIREIRRLFTASEIRDYLDHLENTKYLSPSEPDLEMDDADDPAEDEPCLENPVLGAEKLLRFSRVRQLLQA